MATPNPNPTPAGTPAVAAAPAPTTTTPATTTTATPSASSIGMSKKLWVRRQVFEHSFTAPLVASDLISLGFKDQGDDLWDMLRKDAVIPDPSIPSPNNPTPYISYEKLESWLKAHPHGNQLLAILPDFVEMLALHAPDAFLACNTIKNDASGGSNPKQMTLASPKSSMAQPLAIQVVPILASKQPASECKVPLTEFMIFLLIGAKVKSLAVSGKDSANASWISGAEAAVAGAFNSEFNEGMPVSPGFERLAGGSVAAASSWGGLSPSAASSMMYGESMPLATAAAGAAAMNVSPSTPRKRSQNNQLLQSPGVKSSALYDLLRETSIVVEQMPMLLRCIAWCYGAIPSIVSPPSFSIQKPLLKHLRFLVTAGNMPDGNMKSLEDALHIFEEADSIDAEKLTEILKLALMNGMNYIKQNTPSSAGSASSSASSTQVGASAPSTTASAAPSATAVELEEGPKDLLEISSLDRKTVLRAGTELFPIYGKDLRVSNCSQCTIYLLAPLSRVSIVGCVECSIFVGGACSLSVVGCGRVTVIASSYRFRVTNSIDSYFHVLTNSRPTIVGDNRGIFFAPYNAQYVYFDRDTEAVCVNKKGIDWDTYFSPFLMDSRGMMISDAEKSKTMRLSPDKFLPFAVPITSDRQLSQKVARGDSTSPLLSLVDVPLPDDYKTALDTKTSQVDELRRMIRAAQEERDKETQDDEGGNGIRRVTGSDIQSIVQEYFREWLVSSGNMRQIHDLVRLEQEFLSEGL